MTRKLAAALAALALCGTAQAGVLTYSGYLQDASGEPVTTATTITFRFYPGAAGGTAVWEDAVTVAPSSDGWFSAVLGGSVGNPLDAADFGQPLWLGLQVATDAQEMSPRTRIGTAPYALTVDWAGVTGKPGAFPVDPAAVQSRVTGTCTVGSFVTAVNQDGTVVCATDAVGTGDVTAVIAGTGLTGGGTSGDLTLAVDTAVIQARATGQCAAGSAVRIIDAAGAVTCELDDDTTYSAGSGLALSGTTFSTDNTLVARKDSAAGSQTFDGGTLHLDYASNRVGVGTTAPTSPLEVVGTAEADGFAYRTAKTGTYWMPVVAFYVDQNDPVTFLINYMSKAVGGQANIRAPLNLPAGVTVTALTCEIYDNDAANDYTSSTSGAYVGRRAAGSLASTSHLGVSFGTTGALDAIQTRSGSGALAIDSGAEYVVHVFFSGVPTGSLSLRFYGCRVTYTAPGPSY